MRPYAELHCSSAFSFLDGASLPEDLAARAGESGFSAVALVDRNGVYGAPRFHRAARDKGFRALVGAELTVRPELVEGPISASTSSARAVSLKVASGDVLKVTWTSLSDIWLEGPAVVVYEGKAE